MTEKQFVSRLDAWCRANELSYTVSYWEASDTYEVEIISMVPSENFYKKRVHNFDYFLDWYRDKTNQSS